MRVAVPDTLSAWKLSLYQRLPSRDKHIFMIENHEKSVVVKRKLRNNFTMVSNDILRNKSISLKAKGLMCYLLSLPDDTEIKKTKLHLELKDGRDAVISAFNELIESRYITVEQTVDEELKQFAYVYTIYDVPQTGETTEPLLETRNGFPVTENPLPIYNNKDNTILNKKRSTQNEQILEKAEQWYTLQVNEAVLSGFEHLTLYKKLINYIFASNPLKKPAIGILSLSQQMKWTEFEKLLNQVGGPDKIGKIVDKIEVMINTPKYLKGKESFYLTLRTWLKNERS